MDCGIHFETRLSPLYPAVSGHTHRRQVATDKQRVPKLVICLAEGYSHTYHYSWLRGADTCWTGLLEHPSSSLCICYGCFPKAIQGFQEEVPEIDASIAWEILAHYLNLLVK